MTRSPPHPRAPAGGAAGPGTPPTHPASPPPLKPTRMPHIFFPTLRPPSTPVLLRGRSVGQCSRAEYNRTNKAGSRTAPIAALQPT
jgi:hypothetical protein